MTTIATSLIAAPFWEPRPLPTFFSAIDGTGTVISCRTPGRPGRTTTTASRMFSSSMTSLIDFSAELSFAGNRSIAFLKFTTPLDCSMTNLG